MVLLEKEFGGKANSWLAQYNAGNLDLLLPLTLLRPNEDFSKVRNNFSKRGCGVGYIVRSSAIGDEFGFVDVFDTEVVNNYKDLEDIVGFVKESSRNSKILEYARWEGNSDFDSEISIMIQPYCKGLSGSIIEHPNLRDHYVINLVNERSSLGQPVYQACINDKGEIKGDNSRVLDELSEIYAITNRGYGFLKSFTNEVSIKSWKKSFFLGLIKFKKRTRNASFISNKFSSQVEFGHADWYGLDEGKEHDFKTNPEGFLFYQERQFLPFDFLGESFERDFRIFGNLEKEIELPVIVIENNSEFDMKEINSGIDSIYVFKNLQNKMPLNFMPNNLFAFISEEAFGHFSDTLEHNTFRWLQKAKFSQLFKGREIIPKLSNIETGDNLILTNSGIKFP